MLTIHLLSSYSEDASISGQVLYSGGCHQAAEGSAGEWRWAVETVQGWRAGTQGGGGGLEGGGEESRIGYPSSREVNGSQRCLDTRGGTLHESIERAKADAVKRYKDSQDFFDLLGSQYGEGFKDFYKQTTILFLDVDFSSVQINTTIPMTPRPMRRLITSKTRTTTP